MKTNYRTIFHNGCEWLQYQSTDQKQFLFWKWTVTKWNYIRADYYDYFDEKWEDWERKYGFNSISRDFNRYINSYNTDIDLFVKRYTLIGSWIKYRNEIVRKKRKEAHLCHEQIALRAGSVRPL